MKKLRQTFVILLTLAVLPVLRAENLPAPEKGTMPLSELLASRYDLLGKIIKIQVTHANDVRQTGVGQYSGFCCHHAGNTSTSETVIFPEEAKDFIYELAKRSMGSGASDLYVRVSDKRQLDAVGIRYNKSKNEYSW